MGDFDVRRILINPSSSADLLQASVIIQMGRDLSGLENPGRILSGFNGAATTSLGDIVLSVQAGPITLNVQFSVVQDLSPFNVILGRTWLHYTKAILSTYHQMQLLSPADKDPPTADPLQAIQISEESTHLTHINSLLTPEEAKSIQQSHDVFAWAHNDMKGIHPSVASHRLNVLPTARPIRQRVRRFHPDKQKVIRDEIDKLLEARFIREVEYPDWLANVVVIPKKEGKWRMCVDYTNLNNACPKDSFPLPRIDQIVDSTTGQGMLSFLDAFSGYHQIPIAPSDEEKTAFITPHGLYCYKVMPFRLKKHWCHLSKTDDENLQTSSRPHSGRVETYLLRQQSIGGRRNKVFKDGVNGLGPSKCRPEAPPLLPSPPGGHADRPAPSQHPAQAELDRKNASMGHRVERIWNRVPTQRGWWTLRVNGASRSSGSGVGLLLQSPTGEQLKQAIRLGFPASNNEAEYEVILSGLDLALALSVSRLRVYSDSQLVVRHVQKEYEAKDERMARYLIKARDTLQQFTEWTIEKIKRTENGRVDALAGIAASLPIKEAILLPIHVQTTIPSRKPPLVIPLRQTKQMAKSGQKT
ncbi:Transposon Ty3-I Gag-Pol polyprotein [Vitis vinifera]|uniref:Transposon Ty3-I Gag-Pol polyprotein n=1 Tax=Vitis vinifera TaxID=29760 RepID=A0A438GSW4_VITVI|nr:Transposon Ty3-I Gag-Pol polyprotein [Vitis vinifera]